MDFVKFIDQLSKRNEWNEREKHIENPEPINRKTIEETDRTVILSHIHCKLA